MLVGQGVSRVVDHGERGVRVVVDEVGSGGIPDRRVQPPRHDHCRTRVRRRVIGGELPPFADSLERRLVDERGGRGDVTFVPFEHLRGLDHEVAPEDVVTDLTRSGDDAVLRDVAQSRQQRTDERQTGDLRRAPRGHRLRVVRARRVTDEEVRRPAADLVGEVEQRVEDVVGAAQRFGSDCPAHSREVGIDPPQPGNAAEDRLEASLGLAVVDARAVEYQHGSTGPVLHVVDHHLAHSDLHPRKLTAQGPSRQRRSHFAVRFIRFCQDQHATAIRRPSRRHPLRPQ